MLSGPAVVSAFALLALLPRSGAQDVPAAPPTDHLTQEPAPAAGPQGAAGTAVLRFAILDSGNRPLPGRLTFTRAAGDVPDVFPGVDARPDDLAVRKNVVYTLSGRAAITVPAGAWTVYATRGLEWSRAQRTFQFEAGQEYTWEARIFHEVDTSGWISADFHLHTLTHSGHGDASMKERIISLAGEGVELAVATDHNHNTDYQPTIDELGAGEHMTAVTGNEVSVPIGHFNAFPLDPARPVPDPEATDANVLFKLIRTETNRFGIPPVIQLNHPRWLGIDYFTTAGLDPITGTSDFPTFSFDFDTLEVFNANSGWGYYDADVTDLPVGSGIHSVLQDWFNLLDRGHRKFAVGNSDSHTVHHEFAGYPRNFVPSSTDAPGAIEPGEVATMLRAGRSFTTLGPFVRLTVNGQPSGRGVQPVQVQGQGGMVDVAAVHVEVQAASWIRLDRVRLIVNGEDYPIGDAGTLKSEPRPEGGVAWEPIDVNLPLQKDSWICALVEGDTPLDPIVTGGGRPILPLAVTNPVWIDMDRDGVWISPWGRALDLVQSNDSLRDLKFKGMIRMTKNEHALLVLAAALEGRDYAGWLIEDGLKKFARRVKLCSARAAEIVADGRHLASLQRELQLAEDPYAALTFLRAARACGSPHVARDLAEMFDRFGGDALLRYDHELGPLLPGAPVTVWRVIGYFPSPAQSTLVTMSYPPESVPSTAAAHAGKAGAEVRWREGSCRADGYLDLNQLDQRQELSGNAIAYAQTWLHSPDEREVLVALGTDDGCRVWVGSELVYEENTRHRASPMQHLGTVKLTTGWNRVLFKVENGSGDFGLYLRVLDDEVRAAAEPG